MPSRTHNLYANTGGHMTIVMINTTGKYISATPNTYIPKKGPYLSYPTRSSIYGLPIHLPSTYFPRTCPILIATAIGETAIIIIINKTQQRMHWGTSVIPLHPNKFSGEKWSQCTSDMSLLQIQQNAPLHLLHAIWLQPSGLYIQDLQSGHLDTLEFILCIINPAQPFTPHAAS